jgi:hypothetical protein
MDTFSTEGMTSEFHLKLSDEDASFEQLYSLQRIELTKKLRKIMGATKAGTLLKRLKWLDLSLRKRVLQAAGMQSSADRCKRTTARK